MPELRECPFCGMAGENMAWRNNRGELTLIEHPNTDCPLADMKLYDADLWNHRPTEDRLREENVELQNRVVKLEQQLVGRRPAIRVITKEGK